MILSLKASTECSNDMGDIYENIENYNPNPNEKRKILIVFDDNIANMLSKKKKRNPIITELFIRSRKLKISLVLISQSYFVVPKDIRVNSTCYFIMKIPNKQDLQQTALNHFSNIDFKDFMKIYNVYNVLQNHILF